ncbi:MAG TPA: cytochrome c biogenesis protein ResB [Gammaproteobacteria bacterium]|nr:cytochrome c biogenesis protein ResB [Gammaproteobacteria bacterium]
MNLAITLLVGVAMASVIGTVLKQNQPYPDYLAKFGPFWFEVFRALGLYDVYTAAWFLFILAFLVTSVSVCLWRNAPLMVRAMHDYQEGRTRQQLERLKFRHEFVSSCETARAQDVMLQTLRRHGYRSRVRSIGPHHVLGGIKGWGNRLGYLCTHSAVVLICVGGLLDGNVPLKLGTLLGDLRIETRDLPVAEVPPQSRLPRDNPSFRASVLIPEGQRADAAYVNVADGYLLQPLPFVIALKKFRIEHYQTGQPKSFESDIKLSEPGWAAPRDYTIAVNHPLILDGYSLYQASFEDGGSRLQLRLHPWQSPQAEELETRVNATLTRQDGGQELRLEFTDFRRFNLNPAPGDSGARRAFIDYGPSFTYRLRRADGTAREYVNYMQPVTLQGRAYFLSGVRDSPAEEFRYLHIPADENGTPGRFLSLVQALYDDSRWNRAMPRILQDAAPTAARDATLQSNLEQATRRLLTLFRQGGLDAVLNFVNTVVPEPHRDAAGAAYIKLLQTALRAVYDDIHPPPAEPSSADSEKERELFLQDAFAALSALPLYGSPFYLSLSGYTEVLASGLQITRTPGKRVVYLGFGLLLCGVFLLFYVPYRRVWGWLEAQGDETRVLLAGASLRHEPDFRREFSRLALKVHRDMQARSPPGSATLAGAGGQRNDKS